VALVWYVALIAMAAGSGASSVVHAADDGQEFLTIEQAPGAVFPDANRFERRDVPLTTELRTAIAERLGEVKPSLWEQTFVTFTARRDDAVIGYAVVVEEIGKHRPITSIVGVDPKGKVHDVAVMVYREAYGGDVSRRRFLEQYQGRAAPDRLAGQIRSIAGATLSVDALNRSVKKGLAVVDAVYLHPEVPR
jgi:Na+-translocating ferredoxin:NAD+ oxidoreductase RnfG subunit